jgi:Transglutaminase-like superfamily
LGYRVPLADGYAGTEQTVKVMRRLIDQALNNPQFVRFAVDLVRNVPQYDDFGEVYALFSWVQQNIRYTKDPVTKEKLYPPMELLKIQAGDCDDISMLLGALAIAVGYPARLVTVAANANYPDDFSHVYTEVEVPPGSGKWIAVDAARPSSAFGLAPAVYFRKRGWSLTDDSAQDLQGATRLRGLSGYLGLGDGFDASSVDWTQIIGQTIQEAPQLIAIGQGQSTAMKLPSGATLSTGPYASFMTPYTPGYAVPSAGYGALGTTAAVSSSLFSSFLPWLLIGGLVFVAVKR